MSKDRRHASIMFTDIVGYTSLMGSDEDRAFEVLARNREIHTKLIEEFQGTLIKEMGDGMLISFNLASDAVRCAIEIQKASKEQEIPLKIGIHEGEMVFEGNDVLGDGVNIASRLQNDTKEGCITISGSVFRDIKNKSGIKSELIGEKSFKHVDEPIKVYSVFCDEIHQKNIRPLISKQKAQEKKSIIVLPFVNMSPDPEQEYFSDGLTEEIITDLSYIHNLLVISRNSAMTFKDSGKTTKEIAAKVNVQYVLEGSVRKAGNSLRITAQLIDASTDMHLWAEKYSGTLDDIFDIQEKVSRSIAMDLRIKLSSEEKMKIHERPIDNVLAYDCYLRASREIMSFSKERLESALNLLHKGIEIIGENAVIYAGIAYTYFQYVNLGIEQEKNIKKAEEFIAKALNIDSELAEAHFVLGCIAFHFHGKAHKGIGHLQRAYSIKPDDPDTMAWLAFGYYLVGKTEAAISLTERIIKIDPFNPGHDLMKGVNYFFQGRFDLAQTPILDMHRVASESPMIQFWKSMILIYNDRPNESYEFINEFVKEPGQDSFEHVMIFLKYTIKGDKNKLSSLLTPEISKALQNDGMFSWNMASFYSYLDDKVQSLEWLENAVDHGFINYPLLNEYDKLLNNVRSEERFKKLMKRVKREWENFEVTQ